MRGSWPSVVLVASLAATTAYASPSARLVYLRNPGAESCPDEAAIRSAVAARLGYDPFFAAAPATMFAEISREKDGFRARVKLVDDANTVRGTRELAHRGERCSDIVDAMALSMSIAIDPDSLTRAPKTPESDATSPAAKAADPEPSATAPSEPVAAASKPEAAPPALPPRATVDVRPADAVIDDTPIDSINRTLELGAFGGVWVGAAPALNVSGTAFVRGSFAWASLAAEGRVDSGATALVDGAAVSTSFVGGAGTACWHSRRGIVRPTICVSTVLGSLHAQGEPSGRILTPRGSTAFHASVGPRIGGETSLSRGMSAFAHLDVQTSFRRHELVVDAVPVYALPLVSGNFSVGVAGRLF